ncbi:hypothetical protein BC834DRAFT_86687 [Gloeopeniophorella convolvens]|nr:hypothetical protein BC834DRAFT_86687 [Gloeopeniophorella convolvens]
MSLWHAAASPDPHPRAVDFRNSPSPFSSIALTRIVAQPPVVLSRSLSRSHVASPRLCGNPSLRGFGILTLDDTPRVYLTNALRRCARARRIERCRKTFPIKKGSSKVQRSSFNCVTGPAGVSAKLTPRASQQPHFSDTNRHADDIPSPQCLDEDARHNVTLPLLHAYSGLRATRPVNLT